MPRLIQVIESTRCAGSGIDDDPVRIVTQYFSPEGEYLAEHDSWILSERESVDEQREHLNICDTCGQAYTVNANYDKHDCDLAERAEGEL